MIKDKYSGFSIALLLVLVVAMAVNHFYVESGSLAERLIYVFCAIIFSVAGLLNVSLARDESQSAMERTHALARLAMFIMGAAMALYIAIKGL